MSPTSTSDLAHEEALQRITSYFILRRGRGSAISSRDADALETWARQGHTWMDILQAIDRAFAKRRTAPQSLRACGTYLVRALPATDDLLDPNILAEAFGQASAPPPPSKTKASENTAPSAVQETLYHLEHEANQTPDIRAKTAYLLLHEEISERSQEGSITAETIAVFDEALALLALEQLDPEQRRSIEACVEQAPPTMRIRILLEQVGDALLLNYPLHGRVRSRPAR